MPVVVSFISQKGGVGKSTLARSLAAVSSHAKLKVHVADLDEQQGTLVRWGKLRRENRVAPPIQIEHYASIDDAIKAAMNDDILIVDTAGRVSEETFVIAAKSDLVVQPTGPSLDDLHPAVLVFHGLASAGIAKEQLVFALCRSGSRAEEQAARDYLRETGFEVLPGSIPERVAYRHALNSGMALTETGDAQLNKKVDALLEALLEKIATQFAGREPSRLRKDNEGAA